MLLSLFPHLFFIFAHGSCTLSFLVGQVKDYLWRKIFLEILAWFSSINLRSVDQPVIRPSMMPCLQNPRHHEANLMCHGGIQRWLISLINGILSLAYKEIFPILVYHWVCRALIILGHSFLKKNLKIWFFSRGLSLWILFPRPLCPPR